MTPPTLKPAAPLFGLVETLGDDDDDDDVGDVVAEVVVELLPLLELEPLEDMDELNWPTTKSTAAFVYFAK